MTVKKPTQERSKMTVRSILEASVQMILRTNKDELNTRQVAERAGVSVGSLYQYFKGSDSILETLAREQIDRDIQGILESFSDPTRSSEDKLRAMFLKLVIEHQSNSPVRAVFIRKAHQLGITQMVLEKIETISGRIFIELKKDLPMRQDLDPELATRILSRALFGVVLSIVMESKKVESPEKMADEMTRLLIRYLTN